MPLEYSPNAVGLPTIPERERLHIDVSVSRHENDGFSAFVQVEGQEMGICLSCAGARPTPLESVSDFVSEQLTKTIQEWAKDEPYGETVGS